MTANKAMPESASRSYQTDLTMKTSLKIFSHFGRLPTNITGNFNAMLGVKAQPLLRTVLRSIVSVTGVSLSKSKLFAIVLIVGRLAFLRKRMGLKGLTLYLKGSFVLYQQSLGGYILPDSGKVAKLRVSRTNRGMPRLIPRILRFELRRLDTRTMRMCSTILNVYRDIKFPGTPNLETITKGFTGDSGVLQSMFGYIEEFLILALKSKNAREYMDGGFPPFLIWKAAPGMIKESVFGSSNYSTHPHNILKSLQALRGKPAIWRAFKTVLETSNNKAILELVNTAENSGILLGGRPGAIGKLHAKEEPAGKVRIFAMVDAPTQWALYPLHKFLFSVLRNIPQDGTFNQTAPLERLLARKPKELYSLDLTAATDRLPLALQVMVLTILLGPEFAGAWATLLVDRNYSFRQLGYSEYHGSYRYKCGQPMGAYSSWAMLALTHHLLVQVSAWRAGVIPVGTWFEEYAVLGDDLVIANKKVAEEYLKLLKELGMEVNLSKSLLSDSGRCLEFAKRTIFVNSDGTWADISPIPLKEVGSASQLLPALVQFGVKYSLTPARLLQAFGFGWRNLSQLNKPLGKLSAQVRTIMLGISLPKTADELVGFFNIGKAKLAKYVNDMVQVGIDFKLTTLTKAVPKIVSKVQAAEAVQNDKDNLIASMTTSFGTWLWSSYHPAEEAKMDDLESFEDTTPVVSLTPEVIYIFPPEYIAQVEVFYGLLWTKLYGPAIAGYLETARDVQWNVEAMAGKHRSSSMLVLPSFHSVDSKISYGFFQRYWDFLMTLEDLASASPSVINFSRPEGLEGVSQSQSAVTPLHLRYYRLWSGIIQGSLPVLGLGLKLNRAPTGLTPKEVKVEEDEGDDDY